MVWLVRVLVAALCFGWVTLHSIPALGAVPPGGSEVLDVLEAGTARPANGEGLVCGPQLQLSCLLSLILHRSPPGEFCDCCDNLESALAVLGQPVPTSSLSMAPVLLWAALSHLMLQVGVHWGRERGGERGGGERWGSEPHVSLSSVSAGAGPGGGVPGQLRGPEEERGEWCHCWKQEAWLQGHLL